MEKIILIIVVLVNTLYAQWYDPATEKAIVLVEKESGGDIIAHGTGLIMYNYDSPGDHYIVTCAHLLKNKLLYVSINADSSLIDFFNTHLYDNFIFENTYWFYKNGRLHSPIIIQTDDKYTVLIDSLNNNVFKTDTIRSVVLDDSSDIGVFKFTFPLWAVFENQPLDTIIIAKNVALPISMVADKNEITIGQEVYFIGFPFGYGTDYKLTPIVRSGSIAWRSEDRKIIILDAFSYGGNSGSPIFLKRIFGSNPNQAEWNSTQLIGMITSHINDPNVMTKNILTMPDTSNKKIELSSFEVNIGLAVGVSNISIMELIKKAKELNPANYFEEIITNK